MPGENDSEIDFAPFFDVLYNWLTTFHSLGNKTMFGVGGFTDLVNFGKYSKDQSQYSELAIAHNQLLSRYFGIPISVH
jgi:hypothetical protein